VAHRIKSAQQASGLEILSCTTQKPSARSVIRYAYLYQNTARMVNDIGCLVKVASGHTRIINARIRSGQGHFVNSVAMYSRFKA